MSEFPNAVLTILITSLVAVGLSFGAWLFARKSGLGQLQIAVKSETDRLVQAQKERIELLEKLVEDQGRTIESLTKRVEQLERKSRNDEREIRRLRKVIADKAIEDIEP